MAELTRKSAGPNQHTGVARAPRRRVLLPLPLQAGAYDYALPEGVEAPVGSFVVVPLGPRESIGVVWDGDPDPDLPARKVKPIHAVLGAPPMTESLRRFVEWVAAYTLSPPGAVLRMAMSAPSALEAPAPQAGWRRAAAPPEGVRITPMRRRVLDVLADGAPRAGGELAEAAGVARRTLYNQFTSKEEIFREMLLRVSAQLERAFPPGVETQGDVEEVLGLIARAILDLHKQPEYLGFLRMVAADARQFPWIAEAFAAVMDPQTERFARYLAHLGATGTLDCRNPALAAHQFTGMLNEFVLWPWMMGRKMPVAGIEEVIEETIRTFLQRYRAVPAGRRATARGSEPARQAPPGAE